MREEGAGGAPHGSPRETGKFWFDKEGAECFFHV